MASQGFEDSGQNVKMIKDSSVVPTGYMQDSYVYYGGYTKQETVRKDNVFWFFSYKNILLLKNDIYKISVLGRRIVL